MRAVHAIRRYGMVLCMALAAADVCWAQEVIYVRPPATISGQRVADGQRLGPQDQIVTGAGGVVVVELRNWPATQGGQCTLFVIASGGSSATIPPRRPRECGDNLASLDSAMAGGAVSTSVLLFPAGKADGYGEEALYAKLPRRTPRVIGPPAAMGTRPGTEAAAPAPPAGLRIEAAQAATSAGLRIESATYGANCGAPAGNQTATLVGACNGRLQCDYVVDYMVIGDPAPGCAKDYRVTYQCSVGGLSSMVLLDGEAGFKKVLRLGCQ